MRWGRPTSLRNRDAPHLALKGLGLLHGAREAVDHEAPAVGAAHGAGQQAVDLPRGQDALLQGLRQARPLGSAPLHLVANLRCGWL